MAERYYKIINTGSQMEYHRGDDKWQVASGNSELRTVKLTNPMLDDIVDSWRYEAEHMGLTEL